MKKNILISFYDIELDFENYTIKINDEIYNRDEVEVFKRVHSHTDSVYDGRIGYRVKFGNMYRSHSKPVYKTVTKSYDVLDIKKPNGLTTTIRYNAFEKLNVDTVKAWYDGRDYEEFIQEYTKKQKEEANGCLIDIVVSVIMFVLSAILSRGNFIVCLILFILLRVIWKFIKK